MTNPIKTTIIKAMSKDIPLSQVGQRCLAIATLTDEAAFESFKQAMERKNAT